MLTVEGKILFNAIFVGRVDTCRSSKGATAFGVFGLQQMPLAGPRTQNFSTSGDLETFRYRFLGLNTLWTTHI